MVTRVRGEALIADIKRFLQGGCIKMISFERFLFIFN